MPRGLSTRLVTAARVPTPSTSTTTSWASTDCIQFAQSVDMFWSRTIWSSIWLPIGPSIMVTILSARPTPDHSV